MKTINWNKIPSNKLMGKNNIWTLVANSHQNSPKAELDWTEMEGLFCQQASTSQQNSPKMGARDTSTNSTESANGNERKTRKENSEVIFKRPTKPTLKAHLSANVHLIHYYFSIDHIFGWKTKLEYQYLLKTIPNVSETEPKLFKYWISKVFMCNLISSLTKLTPENCLLTTISVVFDDTVLGS